MNEFDISFVIVVPNWIEKYVIINQQNAIAH